MGNGKSRYTPDEAILMAAWLVALAELKASESFATVLVRLNDTLFLGFAPDRFHTATTAWTA